MADWRTERKEERQKELEGRVLSMREQAKKDEKTITAVENEDVKVSKGYGSTVCCFGTEVETKSLYLETSDDILSVEAGTNGEGLAVISISRLMGDASKLTFIQNEKSLDLVFQGENALSEAYAVLRAATVMLHEKEEK